MKESVRFEDKVVIVTGAGGGHAFFNGEEVALEVFQRRGMAMPRRRQARGARPRAAWRPACRLVPAMICAWIYCATDSAIWTAKRRPAWGPSVSVVPNLASAATMAISAC